VGQTVRSVPMESEAEVFSVDLATGPDATIVRVGGELDLGAVSMFVETIEKIFASGPPAAVTLDLGALTFLDSSGLGALLTLHARCQAEHVEFGAVNAPLQVRRVLELTKLAELFNLHE
jgi:anti-anti-sigma factor